MFRSLFKKNSFHALVVLVIGFLLVNYGVKVEKEPHVSPQRISSGVESLFVDTNNLGQSWQEKVRDWSLTFSPEIFSGSSHKYLNFTFQRQHSWQYGNEVSSHFDASNLEEYELNTNFKLMQDVLPLESVIFSSYQPFSIASEKFSEPAPTLSMPGKYIVRDEGANIISFLPNFKLAKLEEKLSTATGFTTLEISELSRFSPRVKLRRSCGNHELDQFYLRELKRFLQNGVNRRSWQTHFPDQDKSTIDIIWNLK